MDWAKEVESLGTGREFLKLDSGSHSVKFLDDGEEKIVEYDGKEQNKVFFNVMVKDNEYVWTVAKGGTLNSCYGQIALLGRMNGSLVNRTFTVLVKGEGKNKDYTIVEALDLAKFEISKRKELRPVVEDV